jgi:hypothetical protein
MRYDAVAFLEGLFRSPAGEALPDIMPTDLPADWYALWEERAAIMEYDGGLPKEHAEAAALTDTLRRMREAGVELPTTRNVA